MNCLKIVLVLSFCLPVLAKAELCTNYTGDWSYNSQDAKQPLYYRFRFIQPDCQHVQIFSINEDSSVDEVSKLELPRIKSTEKVVDGKLIDHSVEFSYMDVNGDLLVGNFTFKIESNGQVSNKANSQMWKLDAKKNQLTLVTVKHGDDGVENSHLVFNRILSH